MYFITEECQISVTNELNKDLAAAAFTLAIWNCHMDSPFGFMKDSDSPYVCRPQFHLRNGKGNLLNMSEENIHHRDNGTGEKEMKPTSWRADHGRLHPDPRHHPLLVPTLHPRDQDRVLMNMRPMTQCKR